MELEQDQLYTIGTLLLMVLYFLSCVVRRRFDPFAPVWMLFIGYVQLYCIQAFSYREWAVQVRGEDVVAAANFRALWALALFLLVYHFGPGRWLVELIPRPPERWSSGMVVAVAPPLILWGLICAGVMIRGGGDGDSISPEESLFRSFPFVMLVAAIMLIVTGRDPDMPRPGLLIAGLFVAAAYVAIWMFNGKRSHSLLGILTTVCAYYITRYKRPSWGVILATLMSGALAVAISIGWRNNQNYDRSVGGFIQYLTEFNPAKVLESLNIADHEDSNPAIVKSYESEEYGGYLLIFDTVPEKSDYDYGANYLRTFSTFIPRIIWPSKPIFGREQWIKAWIAGSEFERDESFSGPAIGLLAAAHLNGGVTGTIIVICVIACFWQACYAYFLRYMTVPWVKFWWSTFFFNAWFMVVNDDPMVWFYYNWGFTTMPIVVFLWGVNKFSGAPTKRLGLAPVH
jgi:hypothetical protein